MQPAHLAAKEWNQLWIYAMHHHGRFYRIDLRGPGLVKDTKMISNSVKLRLACVAQRSGQAQVRHLLAICAGAPPLCDLAGMRNGRRDPLREERRRPLDQFRTG